MTWKPSPEPGYYDRQRVAQLQPIKDAVSRLGLPPPRRRKITGILNALEMQIEDGGDAPDVNAFLMMNTSSLTDVVVAVPDEL